MDFFVVVVAFVISPLIFWVILAPGWVPVYALSKTRSKGVWSVLRFFLLAVSLAFLVVNPVTFVVVAPLLILFLLMAQYRRSSRIFLVLAALSAAYAGILGGALFAVLILFVGLFLLRRGWSPRYTMRDIGVVGIACAAILLGHFALNRYDPNARVFIEEVQLSDAEIARAQERLEWRIGLHEGGRRAPRYYSTADRDIACYGASYLESAIASSQIRLSLGGEFASRRQDVAPSRQAKHQLAKWIQASMVVSEQLSQRFSWLSFTLTPSNFNVHYVFNYRNHRVGELSLTGEYNEVDWGRVIDCNGNPFFEDSGSREQEYRFVNIESLDAFGLRFGLTDQLPNARKTLFESSQGVACIVSADGADRARLECDAVVRR